MEIKIKKNVINMYDNTGLSVSLQTFCEQNNTVIVSRYKTIGERIENLDETKTHLEEFKIMHDLAKSAKLNTEFRPCAQGTERRLQIEFLSNGEVVICYPSDETNDVNEMIKNVAKYIKETVNQKKTWYAKQFKKV